MKKRLRSHDQIITCLIGDPVEHSVSDVMFQHFAKLSGQENYYHLKLRISSNNPKNLKLAIRAINVFDMSGANITLPYKERAIKYLDKVDKTVLLTGAVNTIVNKKGEIFGHNTDGYGAIKAIETKLRLITRTDKVAIFGSGGAARAIIGSFPRVANITVLGRASDSRQMKKLDGYFSRKGIKMMIKLLTEKNIILAIKEANFVINATPVGMFPRGSSSLIHRRHLEKIGKLIIKDKFFFDAVFNPFETKFLTLAKKYGAKTCPGIYMMIYQGIKAFKLWTGESVSESSIETTRRLLKIVITSTYEK